MAKSKQPDEAPAAAPSTTETPQDATSERQPDPAPPDEAPAAAPAPAPPPAPLVLMPEAEGRRDQAAIDLLLEACDIYGIHPGADQRPRELAAWRYYPPNALDGVAASVVVITAGGCKLRHYAGGVQTDPDTEERLRAIFRAFVLDKTTKQMVPTALPQDLTLPESLVTGQVTTTRHRHEGGYLRRPRP